jgi:hypothetical protein
VLKAFLYVVCLLFLSLVASAQTASLRGQVFDQSGAVVPKAIVTLTGPSGLVKTATSVDNGSYSSTALPPGRYTVHAAVPNLEQQPIEITLKPSAQEPRLELKIAVNQQQTTVQGEAGTGVSTESANNASLLILRGKDLHGIRDSILNTSIHPFEPKPTTVALRPTPTQPESEAALSSRPNAPTKLHIPGHQSNFALFKNSVQKSCALDSTTYVFLYKPVCYCRIVRAS